MQNSVITLLKFFAPFLLQRGYQYYRSVQNSSTNLHAQIVPPSREAQRSLTLLFLSAVAAFILSLPYFAPPEIFGLTNSRLQTPVQVLFARLSSLSSPPGSLSESQNTLREHLLSLESKLLYFTYGPSVISNCKFCNPDSPSIYFYYALPSILGPHLLHLGILALSTSGLFGGPKARKWRVHSTLAAIGLAAMEIWFTYSYNHQANAAATRLGEIYPFFWRMRVYRLAGFAFLSAVTGYLIFLTSTNRAFVEPPPTYMRVADAATKIDEARAMMRLNSALRNAVARDSRLREIDEGYWIEEERLQIEIAEDDDVRQAMNTVGERMDMERITNEADNFAKIVVNPA